MTTDPRIEEGYQALNRLRARRDEVEQLLRANGWELTCTIGDEHYWRRASCDDVCTPAGRPSLDTAEEWAKMLDEAARIADKPISTVALMEPIADPSPLPTQEAKGEAAKHAPHDAARDWAALVGAESSEIPTMAQALDALNIPAEAVNEWRCVVAEDSEIPTPEALRVERAEAKAEIDRLTAAADYERERANEAIARAHDAERARDAKSALLSSVLNDLRKAEGENMDAVHLLQLLGVNVGTLPDMITALLPASRLMKLRIRNESQTRLAVDNLSLQEVAETDPRMVEAVAAYREAVALRMAAEPVRDHSPDAGKMVEP
jgi:hypothetical protein